MHVVTLSGSWQPGSANRSVIEVATRRLLDAGATVDAFDALRTIPPFDPTEVDTAPEPVSGMQARIAAADLVLIAAPEYAGALAGVVKNALDWLVGAGSMWDRTVGVVCAGTTGGWFARRDLAQTLAWQGALVVAHLGIAAPRTKSDAAGNLTDPPTLDAIDRFVDDLLKAADQTRAARIATARAVAAEFGLDPLRVAGGADD